MGSPSLTGGGMRLTLIIVLIGFIGLSLGSLAETGEGGTQLEAQDGKFRDVRAAEAARLRGSKKTGKKNAGRKNGNGRMRQRKAEKKNGRNESKNGNRSKSNKKQRNLKNGRKRKGQ